MEQNRKMNGTLHEVVRKIVKEYRPEKIILFGSYAWGTPTEDSDIDLFIIKESNKRRIDRAREVREIIWGAGMPIDILVYTSSEIKRRIEEYGDLFIKDVIKNGKLLYPVR